MAQRGEREKERTIENRVEISSCDLAPRAWRPFKAFVFDLEGRGKAAICTRAIAGESVSFRTRGIDKLSRF